MSLRLSVPHENDPTSARRSILNLNGVVESLQGAIDELGATASGEGGFASLGTTIAEHTATLAEHAATLTTHEDTLTTYGEALDSHDDDLDSLDTRLDNLDNTIESTSSSTLGFFGASPVSQQSAVSSASTSHSITDPADYPYDVDALRDDLVANAIPDIEDALDALGTKVNAIITRLENLGLFA